MSSPTTLPSPHAGITRPTSNNNNLKRDLIFLYVTLTVASLLALFKIVTTKQRKGKIPFIEDCLLLISVLFIYAYNSLVLVSVFKYDLGRHVWELSVYEITKTAVITYTSSFFTLWAHGTVRLSFLLFIRRLFSAVPKSRKWRHMCDLLMVAELVAMIFGTVSAALNHGRVLIQQNQVEQYRVQGLQSLQNLVKSCIWGIILDICILMTPLPLLWKLRSLSMKKRVQILLALSLGLMTLSASVVRLIKLLKLRERMMMDSSYNFKTFIIITQIEAILALLTICVPTAADVLEWAYNDQIDTSHSSPNSTESTLVVVKPSDDHEHRHSRSTHRSAIEGASRRGTVVAVQDDVHDDDDENFFDLLVPSDQFFPLATGLTPRSRPVQDVVVGKRDVSHPVEKL